MYRLPSYVSNILVEPAHILYKLPSHHQPFDFFIENSSKAEKSFLEIAEQMDSHFDENMIAQENNPTQTDSGYFIVKNEDEQLIECKFLIEKMSTLSKKIDKFILNHSNQSSATLNEKGIFL